MHKVSLPLRKTDGRTKSFSAALARLIARLIARLCSPWEPWVYCDTGEHEKRRTSTSSGVLVGLAFGLEERSRSPARPSAR